MELQVNVYGNMDVFGHPWIDDEADEEWRSAVAKVLIDNQLPSKVYKPGHHECQEACVVSRRESKDFKSCQEALGKGQSASKEGSRLIATQQRTSFPTHAFIGLLGY